MGDHAIGNATTMTLDEYADAIEKAANGLTDTARRCASDLRENAVTLGRTPGGVSARAAALARILAEADAAFHSQNH